MLRQLRRHTCDWINAFAAAVGQAILTILAVFAMPALAAAIEFPRSLDNRVKIELVAAEPDLVTPTGLAVTRDGRVLVIESHTHFRPDGYLGPPTDRILSFPAATSGNVNSAEAAAQRSIFYSGTTHTMNLAVAPDGGVFVATRMEVFRLDDVDRDGAADNRTLICRLETKGDYPHNGLSGFAFDHAGNVYFGMGENLGVEFTLIGSDGKRIYGVEGGHIFRCRADGSRLERFATGFWNPFHLCFDGAENLFAVDNDPDSRPPCRLLHVVDGGDYGYKFRNGRRGTHPYTAWNGELPGTLPMVAGTGEAPSGVVCYRANQLPEDYRDQLLVTSWGDHRIDRFKLEPSGASFRSAAKPLIQGDENFRPVGIAVAPDGSLYVSDWVDKSYNVHGKGRLWRISSASAAAVAPPAKTTADSLSPANTTVVDVASDAERLARFKRQRLTSFERAALLRLATSPAWSDEAWRAVDDDDPFVRQAGCQALTKIGEIKPSLAWPAAAETPRRHLAALLIQRSTAVSPAESCLAKALQDADPAIRFLALKWIGEENLSEFANQIDQALTAGPIDALFFAAYLATVERVSGGLRPADDMRKDEWGPDQYLADLVWRHNDTPPLLRRWALRSLSPSSPFVTAESLNVVIDDRDPAVRLEAVRTLCNSVIAERGRMLISIAANPSESSDRRAEAAGGLSPDVEAERQTLFDLLEANDERLRVAALRGLRGSPIAPDEARRIVDAVERQPVDDPELVAMLIGGQSPARPAADNLDAWVKLLDGPANAASGERIFYQARQTMCVRCHEVAGRGGRIGPELTVTARALDRRRLVESILQPSREIAPQFVPWTIETTDGRAFTGLWIAETMETDQLYALSTGEIRSVRVADIAQRVAQRVSIMPEDIHKLLTLQELRDLIAFLQSTPSAD